MGYVYGNYYSKNGSSYQLRSYLTYEAVETATTYGLTLVAYVQCNTSNDVGTTGLSISVTGTGQTTKSKSSQTYYKTQADSDNKKVLISSWTWTWNKTSSTASKTVKATLSASNMTSSVATYNFTVPALATYEITYDAGVGTLPTGFVNPQIKTHGIDLIINSGIPTRTGYTFFAWKDVNLNLYRPNDTYTVNDNITLTATWTINTSTISYNNNGGSGSISNQIKYYGQTLKLSKGKNFSRENYTLTGWNTASDGSGTAYEKEQELSTTFLENLTLYAQWHYDYNKPVISNVNCYRVNDGSATAETDTGTFIRVTFDYVNGTNGGTPVSSKCIIKIDNTTVYGGSSGTTLSSTPFIQNFGTYSSDTSHVVTIKVFDDIDDVGVTASASITTAIYPIDLRVNSTTGTVEMGIMYPAQTGQTITFNGDMYFYIDSNAGSNTTDGKLYALLTARGMT